LEFTALHGRQPAINRNDDLALFTTLAIDKHRSLELPSETLRAFMQGVGA
jgi:hypothetical protein